MTTVHSISINELRRLLRYDRETGKIFWKVTRNNFVQAGCEAGYLRKDGYRIIGLNGKHVPQSHVAWALEHGEWPEHEIDHKDRNQSDNKLKNLRPSNRSSNTKNTLKPRSQSGFRGVYPHQSTGKFNARINRDGSSRSLGLFSSATMAAQVYDAAVLHYYGPDYPTNKSLGYLT